MQAKAITRVEDGIKIEWTDGHSSTYSPKYLRRRCPCAVCREVPGRGADGSLPLNKVAASIEIESAQPIGWYALQFVFSDKHETGIYSFENLRKFCPCAECSPAK